MIDELLETAWDDEEMVGTRDTNRAGCAQRISVPLEEVSRRVFKKAKRPGATVAFLEGDAK